MLHIVYLLLSVV